MANDITPRWQDIIQRLMSHYGLRYEKDLAAILGVRPNSIAYHKLHDRIPYSVLTKLADREDMSLDWLIFGKEPMTPTEFATLAANVLQELLARGDDTARFREALLGVLATRHANSRPLSRDQIRRAISAAG